MSGDNYGIIGWQKNSFIDFPGTVSTVLFFRGCNLRCPYCHNPQIVLNQSEEIPFQLILDHLHKRQGIIEGVVLSGGEATLHSSVSVVVEEIRKLGLKIKLDTNGLLPDAIRKCAPDYLALDLKTEPSRYAELGYSPTNAPSALIESIAIVKQMKSNAEVRITVAPGLIDEKVIKTLAGLLDGVEKVFLQQFQNEVELLDRSFNEKPPVSLEQIQEYKQLLTPHVGHCTIRGQED